MKPTPLELEGAARYPFPMRKMLSYALAQRVGQTVTVEMAREMLREIYPDRPGDHEQGSDADADVIRLVAGNRDAADLIHGWWRLCEVWDDAIDGEKAETDEFIHRAFEWALFDLQANPFYRAHPELESALRVCIANWKAANQLEQSREPEHLHTAYTLRCSPYDFFVAVALASAGPEAADRAALHFRGQLTNDTLSDYIKSHLKG